MATHTFRLQDGFKIAGAIHYEVELREPTAEDSLAATEAAERPVATPAGWQLMVSPSRLGLEIALRQVVRIDDYAGPLTRAELKGLSARDLNSLLQEAGALEGIAAQAGTEAARRGRGDQGAA